MFQAFSRLWDRKSKFEKFNVRASYIVYRQLIYFTFQAPKASGKFQESFEYFRSDIIRIFRNLTHCTAPRVSKRVSKRPVYPINFTICELIGIGLFATFSVFVFLGAARGSVQKCECRKNFTEDPAKTALRGIIDTAPFMFKNRRPHPSPPPKKK